MDVFKYTENEKFSYKYRTILYLKQCILFAIRKTLSANATEMAYL